MIIVPFESGRTIDIIVAPQLVILTEKFPFFSTYTPASFFASVPPANEEDTKHRSARNTRALAIRLARRKKTMTGKILLPLFLFIDLKWVLN